MARRWSGEILRRNFESENAILRHALAEFQKDISKLTEERNAATADALHYKAIAESLAAEREQHGYGLPRCAVCDMWLGDDIHKGFDGELCHQSCCTMCGDNITHDGPSENPQPTRPDPGLSEAWLVGKSDQRNPYPPIPPPPPNEGYSQERYRISDLWKGWRNR